MTLVSSWKYESQGGSLKCKLIQFVFYTCIAMCKLRSAAHFRCWALQYLFHTSHNFSDVSSAIKGQPPRLPLLEKNLIKTNHSTYFQKYYAIANEFWKISMRSVWLSRILYHRSLLKPPLPFDFSLWDCCLPTNYNSRLFW